MSIRILTALGVGTLLVLSAPAPSLAASVRPGGSAMPIDERPLAPVSLKTLWAQCYGRNHVSWNSVSDNAQWWEAQQKPSGTSTWTSAYSGSVSTFTIDVTVSTQLRVRACNWVGCSAYTDSPPARYYPQCPVPY